MNFQTNIARFADQYDAFILDLWGVIHDGTHLYPGVKETLTALRQKGKKIVFLSNAPRRAEKVEERLNELGITPDLYDHVVSSGEVAFHFLAQPQDVTIKYFYMGPEKDADLLDGLNFERVDHPFLADMVLNVDLFYPGQQLEELDELLLKMAARNLPMACVNPDIEVVKQDGTHWWCAGAVARRYEALGGEADYFGKPFPEAYEVCRTLLGKIQNKLILCVGDNPDTDIRGANLMEMDSALVLGGILSRTLGHEANPFRLKEICDQAGSEPTYVIPHFGWESAGLKLVNE